MSSVSVVIPCYKYGKFLEECAASVLDDQPGVDVRVLIIDDASPDDSADVAKTIAARDSRVEVVVHAQNQGNIATFNEGLMQWADGDYSVLLSADDRLTPGALRRAVDVLDANPGVGFVYGHALWCVEGAPVPTARARVQRSSVWRGERWLEHRFRQAENPIITPEVVVRTAVQRRVGGYDPQLPKAADMEMWMRLATNAEVAFIRGADQAYYRVHGQNMSAAVSPLMDLRQRRSVFHTVLDRSPVTSSEAKRLSGMVDRQLSRQALWAAGRTYYRDAMHQNRLVRRLLAAGATEDAQDVDQLLTFAIECWPGAARSPLYRSLHSGDRVPLRGAYQMVEQKARWWLRRRSWKYRGV